MRTEPPQRLEPKSAFASASSLYVPLSARGAAPQQPPRPPSRLGTPRSLAELCGPLTFLLDVLTLVPSLRFLSENEPAPCSLGVCHVRAKCYVKCWLPEFERHKIEPLLCAQDVAGWLQGLCLHGSGPPSKFPAAAAPANIGGCGAAAAAPVQSAFRRDVAPSAV